MPDLFHVAPVSVVQTIAFDTDIIRHDDGTEQRIALRKKPRQTYELEFALEDEDAIREWRRNLFNRGAASFYLPLWHEVLTTTTESAAAQPDIDADYSLSDLAATQLVMIETPDGATYETGTIQSITASTITLTGNLANTYPAGSRVYPVELALLGDGAGYERYSLNAARMRIRATVEAHRALGGNGAAALATYNTLTLLDERPLLSGLEGRRFEWDIDRADYGGVIVQTTGRTFADIVTARRFLVADAAQRQRWKLLLDTQVGAREPLYAPTWRDDLVLDSQPSSGSSTIDVLDEPDYITEYEASAAHAHLQLETAAGIVQREVTSAVDNLDGTITLTLSPALGLGDGSVINRISFLEQARLGDVFRYTHGPDVSVVDCTVRVVQQ